MKKKKPIFKKWWFWVLVVLVLLIAVGASGGSGKTDSEKLAADPAGAAAPAEESPTDSASAGAAVRENPLDAIPLSAEEKREVYREVAQAFFDSLTADGAASLSAEEQQNKEDEIIAEVAARHGISADEVSEIYLQASYGFLYDFDPASLKIQHGELLDARVVDTALIVKAKISSSYSNKATVDQNYYNVCNIVQKQGGDVFDEIQYWAVADMSDGSEGKVISFTVGRDLIERVAAGNFADNTLGDYLEDLWILPSLRG